MLGKMEKNKDTKLVIIACAVTLWLLSLVVVAQCAIDETNWRHARNAAERSFSIPSTHSEDYNTPLNGFEEGFEEGLKAQ